MSNTQVFYGSPEPLTTDKPIPVPTMDRSSAILHALDAKVASYKDGVIVLEDMPGQKSGIIYAAEPVDQGMVILSNPQSVTLHSLEHTHQVYVRDPEGPLLSVSAVYKAIAQAELPTHLIHTTYAFVTDMNPERKHAPSYQR